MIMQLAEEKAARVEAFKEAMARPWGQKPSEVDWLAGRWAAQTRALLEFALQIVEEGVTVQVIALHWLRGGIGWERPSLCLPGCGVCILRTKFPQTDQLPL